MLWWLVVVSGCDDVRDLYDEYYYNVLCYTQNATTSNTSYCHSNAFSPFITLTRRQFSILIASTHFSGFRFNFRHTLVVCYTYTHTRTHAWCNIPILFERKNLIEFNLVRSTWLKFTYNKNWSRYSNIDCFHHAYGLIKDNIRWFASSKRIRLVENERF